MASRKCLRARILTLVLHQLGNDQRMTKPLVVNDPTLVNFRQPVVSRVWKHHVLTTELNVTINAFTHRAVAVMVILKQKQHFIVANRVCF